MGEESAGGAVGVGDAVLLAPLTEDTFLHNLQLRYKHDIIYTYAGGAVISVNPCRRLALYSAELARAYVARAPYQLPPHVYAVAATAYRCVRDRRQPQCIVVTGESGSGKTEAARVCLQCAVVAGGGGASAAAGAGVGLTAAGTLLEAFGHAATLRNHNASRFGKLLDVELDFRGDPAGGHVTHYLLEKSRVTGVAEGERNFHVFYQLLAGADPHLLKRLKLQRNAGSYRILRSGSPVWSDAPHTHVAPTTDGDEQHFAFTTAAMRTVGLEGTSGGVLRMLAFILKLGNVEFVPAPHIDGSLAARASNYYEVSEACALVGVDEEALLGVLGAAPPRSRTPPVGSPPLLEEPHHDEGVCGPANGEGAAWAAAARDRLLATLYSRLFVWLVGAVNDHIQPRDLARRPTLAILDMYGLECLERNALEQLVINYAAERVQHIVTGVARREQELYEREGLPWQRIPFADDRQEPLADLLDNGPDSVVGTLRECSARGLPDSAFVQRLGRRRDPRLLPLPPHLFQIQHFGGPITYSASGIVDKNRDGVCARAAAVLRAAREPLLRLLFPDGPSPRRPAALACRQRALLAALSQRLAGGPPPRLVRCLRADAALRPRHFDAHLIRHQIRTQSIMEMVQIRRAGWCEAMCARELVARYIVLKARSARSTSGSPVRVARRLVRALPLPAAEFAYGRTKVFIRSPRTLWELEALRWARVVRLVTVVQRAWRRHRERAHARRQHQAQKTIARAWRRHKAECTQEVSEEHNESCVVKVCTQSITCGNMSQKQQRAHAAAASRRTAWAATTIQYHYVQWLRRRYLTTLWSRLPAHHMSPLCAAWPLCPAPRLLGSLDTLLQRIHHRWRCHKYRLSFDQTARNRMREKVTASILFKDRKQNYPRSVAHPFVGDYVRLRASAAWRRACAVAAPHRPHPDHYVVFADVVGKVTRSNGRVRPALAVVSTSALLLLEARTLRVKRRVPAPDVYRLSLSPFADDVLVVHVRACPGPEMEPDADTGVQWSGGAGGTAGCLFAASGEAGARTGDLVLQTCHVLELATKLFLVVQNAVGAPPHVNIAAEFEANFGQQIVTISFVATGGAVAGSSGSSARLVRRGSRMDVLV
ncbi:Unconventional myosin-Ib [Eumeta japonica]|uniref:Unconventional myosin-Ib n=1 Tax=Eumeta variegata TaxID=151549 RepID=A0A4C1WBC6_EUMVA|nr:Unconventional myosin-Ib [Eumeta japonica]